MSGEETQAKGAEGARKAKVWLDATTRAEVRWVNPEPIAVPKLTFKWADGGTFSFDLAGVLRGEKIENQEFYAECKKYQNAQDQGQHYRKFLAQCYRAFKLRPERCDNFLWITWAPFNVTTWDKLQDPKIVEAAVLALAERSLGAEDANQAAKLLDKERCKEVADRLRMIVLSDWQQENLSLTTEHLAVIRSYRTQAEAR
jgi:hypothetical protein